MLELSSELIEVVVDDVEFGEYFGSLQLVDSVTKVIGCCIGLDGEFQLGHNFLVYSYFECHITDWNLEIKTILNLSNPKSRFFFVFLFIFLNKSFDWLDGSNDVWDREENALASDHITDFELNALFLIQKLIDLIFVLFLFNSECLFNSVFNLFLNLFIFVEEHLLLNSYHRFRIRKIRVQLQTNFSLNAILQTSLSEKLFKMSSIIFGNLGVF